MIGAMSYGENFMSGEVKLFEGNTIRSVWDNEKEEWYFSVVDVVGALTGSSNPRDYWYRVKKRMSEEEKSQLSTICRQLKLEAADGKKYNTDAANMQGIFRIIQSIPSPKAEPFKMWLAEVGKERIDTELTNTTNPQGFEENKKTAQRGGRIAGHARKEIEAETGKPVVSPKNAIDFSKLIDDVTKAVPEKEK